MPLSECKEATPAWIGNFWDIPILSVCLCIDHMGHLHMCVHVCRHQRSTSNVCWSSGAIHVLYSDRVSHWPEAHRRLGWLTSSIRHCLSLPPQILQCKKAALVQQALYRLSCPPALPYLSLLFQRSWVQFPATTWWLTTICNKIWRPLLECLKAATVYLHTLNQSINQSILKRKRKGI